MATPADDFLDPSKISPRQWLILTLGVMAAVLDGYDIIIVAYTAPAISQEWSVSPSEMGVLFSASVFGMALGAMFLAWLADRFGRCIVVSAALLIAGVATLLAAYSQGVTSFVALRFLAGLALGVLVATLPALVGEFSPRLHRTAILGVLMAGNSIGGFVGGQISAELITEHGWKSLYFYAGLGSILLGIAIYFLVPESLAFIAKRNPSGALQRINRILTSLGQATVQSLPALAAETQAERATVFSLLTPTRRMTTLLCWSTFFCGFLAVYFISSWVPQILVNTGFAQVDAIRATSFMALGSILGTLLLGFIARWVALNLLIAVMFAVGACVMYALNISLSNVENLSFGLISVMMFVIGVSMMAAFSSLYTVAMTIYPVQVRSTGLGWAAGLGRFGAVLSPILAGAMIDMGVAVDTMFLYFSIPVLLAAVGIKLVKMQEMA